MDALFEDKLFFSNPNDFNDPFDSNPHLENNIGVEEYSRMGSAYGIILKKHVILTEQSEWNISSLYILQSNQEIIPCAALSQNDIDLLFFRLRQCVH